MLEELMSNFLIYSQDYYNYLIREILHFHWKNWFYLLIFISLCIWALEVIFPWRKNQSKFRKDFFLDAFYMFWNVFLFSLIGFAAVSNIAVDAFKYFLALFGLTNLIAVEISAWPWIAQLLLMFILRDFIQWNIHRLLHHVPMLWTFHKVHHSVKEMGFAAHLRFHWMESVVYRVLEYIPLAMIGFGIKDFFLVHIFSLLVGHLNHANLNWNYGPLKYIFNNPAMHIWHHAKNIGGRKGVNFGLSLSIWDYLFGTVHIPKSGKDEELGFDGDDKFPKSFLKQCIYPIIPRK